MDVIPDTVLCDTGWGTEKVVQEQLIIQRLPKSFLNDLSILLKNNGLCQNSHQTVHQNFAKTWED